MKKHIMNKYRSANVEEKNFRYGLTVETRAVEESDEDFFGEIDATKSTFTDEATDEDSFC